MTLFSRFSKSAFWTQFLIGLVAVFSLPAVSGHENVRQETVSEQQLMNVVQSSQKSEVEQCLFLSQEHSNTISLPIQAVDICIFSTKLYRLPDFSLPFVRAGPDSLAL